MDRSAGEAEGRRDVVRIQFTRPGQPAGQSAGNRIVSTQECLHLLFHERLAVLHDEDLVGGGRQRADLGGRQRILGDFQQRNAFRKHFAHIVIGDAAGDDAQAFSFFQGIVGRLFGAGQEVRLLVDQRGVLPAGVAGQQDPAGPLAVGRQRVLGDGFADRHGGPGMGQAGDHPEEDRKPDFLRQAEGFGHQVIAFLLVGRLEDGDQGELPVKAGVLFVLGGMHRRVVGHVHSHMLHADQRPLAREGHAQGGFHGRFLVGAPAAPHPAFPREGVTLDEFRDFGGGGSGIGVHPGQAGVERSQGQSLVTEQQSFDSHSSESY